MIEEIPIKLFRDNYIYKVGLDYKLLVLNEHKIRFYFEDIEEMRKQLLN